MSFLPIPLPVNNDDSDMVVLHVVGSTTNNSLSSVKNLNSNTNESASGHFQSTESINTINTIYPRIFDEKKEKKKSIESESVVQRLPSVDQRLPAVDHRLPAIDHRLPSIDHRLSSIDQTAIDKIKTTEDTSHNHDSALNIDKEKKDLTDSTNTDSTNTDSTNTIKKTPRVEKSCTGISRSMLAAMICLTIALPHIVYSGMSIYSNKDTRLDSNYFVNITNIVLTPVSKFNLKWQYEGMIEDTDKKLHSLSLKHYCGTFKSYYTTLEYDSILVNTCEKGRKYDKNYDENNLYIKDHTGKNTFIGNLHANDAINRGVLLIKSIKSTKDDKNVAYFFRNSSSIIYEDIYLKNSSDRNGSDIYRIKRGGFPVPSFLQIIKLNQSDISIEDVLVLIGAQTFSGVGRNDVCNQISLAGFVIGLFGVIISCCFCCYASNKYFKVALVGHEFARKLTRRFTKKQMNEQIN
jgi:hypothetical protein